MNHFIIDAKLTLDQQEALVQYARRHATEFHMHSVGVDYTNLDIMLLIDNPTASQVIEQFSIKPTHISLMRVAPNATIVPHVDGKDYQRLSVVVFPILPSGKKFAPTSFYKDANDSYSYSSECYAFDTQQMHGVENNDHHRLSLQLWYDIPLTDLKNMKITDQTRNKG